MPDLSRRSLLVSGAVAGVAAAAPAVAAPVAPSAKELREAPALNGTSALRAEPAAPDLKITETFSLGKSMINEGECITAARWGLVRPVVRGGKLVDLKPFEYDWAPTPNINGLANLPYSPNRIRYPMVRESYLKDGIKSRKNRGKDRWVRVSWDKAFELCAAEINRVYDNYGPSAVFGRSYGWMSTGRVNASISLLNRMLNLRGGFIQCCNNYSQGCIQTIMPYVLGAEDPKVQSWEMVLKHSQRVVFWGCDPLVTNDIDWFTTLHNGAGYFRALKAKGTKTIAINPLKPDTAEYFGSEWIAPRPGTDTAMMLGMIHEIARTKKLDNDFIKRCVSGWDKFMDYVLGKTDGTPKTPEWAESKCGVPAKQIVELAHELRDNRTMIMMGWGIQRAEYGEQPHWMGVALACALGQMGLPGGGIGTDYHYSNGGSPACEGPALGGISGAPKPVIESDKPWKGSKVIPVQRFVDCFLNPGQTIDHNGNKITYPEVRLVMWAGGNPFAHQPQTNKLREAWKKPETVIVSDYVWTATARHADIVLPACTVFEHNDITNIGSYSNDGLVAMQQAIAPQWESKTDYEIFAEISKRIGVGDAFTEGLDEMGWIKKLYNAARDMGAKIGQPLPDFETFWKQGYVLYPPSKKEREFVDFADFRKDPETYDLDTESGLIQIFSPKIAGYGYKDCLGHPSYFEPTESLNRKDSKYPLAYLCCKSRYRLHSQLDGTTCHDFANIDGREPCWIHPEDAKARGIADGDIVLVRNDRGALLAGAYITDRVMKGAVVVHHGGWYDPVETKSGVLDSHGNANTLTVDKPASSLSCANIASSALVEVSKYQGQLPPHTVYQQPEMVR